MTIQQLVDEYERMIKANAIVWLDVTRDEWISLHQFTTSYLIMFNRAGIRYRMGSVQLGDSVIFKVDDPLIGWLIHYPTRCEQRWLKPDHHEVIDDIEAVIYLYGKGYDREHGQ